MFHLKRNKVLRGYSLAVTRTPFLISDFLHLALLIAVPQLSLILL